MKNIILFGAPGCGKGTQAHLIAEKYGFVHVSTGEIFRHEISNKTPLGLKAHELISRGELCPDNVTMSILNNHIQKQMDSKGFIFDGVPRTVKQAEMLDDETLFHNLKIDLVLYLYVETEEVEKRILHRAQLENREDDTPETVKARVAHFFDQTMPLEKYYSQQGKIVRINGMQDIEHVFADICKTIEAE